MNENESAIKKLEEYAASMIKESIPYGKSIESLIPYLKDRYEKEEEPKATTKELKEHCKDIAETLERLCDGERYDVEEGVFIDEDEVLDEYDEERYQDLYWYLQDNLGIKVLTDLDRETMYGCEICVAWGGPNIYINTNTRNIEGYWGFDEVTYPLSSHVCDEIDDIVDEMRGYY